MNQLCLPGHVLTARAGFLIRWDSLCQSQETNLTWLNGKVTVFLVSEVRILKLCLGHDVRRLTTRLSLPISLFRFLPHYLQQALSTHCPYARGNSNFLFQELNKSWEDA